MQFNQSLKRICGDEFSTFCPSFRDEATVSILYLERNLIFKIMFEDLVLYPLKFFHVILLDVHHVDFGSSILEAQISLEWDYESCILVRFIPIEYMKIEYIINSWSIKLHRTIIILVEIEIH